MSINLISRPDNERDLFIFRYPLLNETIQTGATLVVQDNEAAVLVNNGKVYDVFIKGEHKYKLSLEFSTGL